MVSGKDVVAYIIYYIPLRATILSLKQSLFVLLNVHGEHEVKFGFVVCVSGGHIVLNEYVL